MTNNQKQPTDAELNKFLHVVVLGKEPAKAFNCIDPGGHCQVETVPCKDCDYHTYVDVYPSYTTGNDEVRALILGDIEEAELRIEVIRILEGPASHGDDMSSRLLYASIPDILQAFKSAWQVKKGD